MLYLTSSLQQCRTWNTALLLPIGRKSLNTRQKWPTSPSTRPTSTPDPALDEKLFIHFEYHRNDIPRSRVRALYDHHCKDLFQRTLGIQQLIVAYSRPLNLQELLTKAKLHQASGQEVSTFMGGQPPR